MIYCVEDESAIRDLMLFSLGQMGQWVFDRFVIASGKSHLFLFTLSAASITNLILDPIFIFPSGWARKARPSPR